MSSFFKSMDISASGLSAQRIRMNIVSANLANAETTRTPNGGPYKRQDVIFSAKPIGPTFADELGRHLSKVEVTDIHQDLREARKVYNPSHADADASGYVSMPNIQVMTEMVNMITATRAYEANATVFNETKNMAKKSLEIGN